MAISPSKHCIALMCMSETKQPTFDYSNMARSSSRASSHRLRQKHLTREQLLPLPVAKSRAISLEHHLALAALYSGYGGIEQMSVLLKVVYLVHFIANATHERIDSGLLRSAEASLRRCGLRGHHEGRWALSASGHAVLAQVLILHDEQLGSLPAFRYANAWTQIHAFLASDALSPLSPGSDI
ncbi:hypothetical protein [Burkholderia sp. Bp8986]|uniref:hypothetical protein n=1 Tax=Burkholderia sp. Bp8986 TaxID=2184550 RepID=UPI000F59B95E|nr:hypothetical protein [Burkholderia sp. Bp8986]